MQRKALLAALALQLLLLPAGCWADQQAPVVLRGSGTNATAAFVLKAWSVFKARSGVPVELEYRIVPDAASAAYSDLLAGVTSPSTTPLHFAVGLAPLTPTQYSSLLAVTPTILQAPLAMHTLSFYYNVPGAAAGVAVNLTSCLLARILSGAVTSWSSPDVAALNPFLAPLSTAAAIVVLVDDASTAASASLQAYLKATTATSSCSVSWTSTPTYAAGYVALAPGALGATLQRTPYSLGYALSAVGKAWGLAEVAVQNKAGQFVTSATMSATATQTSFAALPTLPALSTSSWAAVQSVDMTGPAVLPATLLNYLVLPTNTSQTSDFSQQVLQAFATFLLSPEVQSAAYCAQYSLLPVNATLAPATAATAALAAMVLPVGGFSTAPWSFEAALATSALSSPGAVQTTVSARRTNYQDTAIADLYSKVATLQAALNTGGYSTLHGSGSSAIAAFIWLILDTLSSRSASPLWPAYRAVGSGAGSDEIVGANNGFLPWTDFGAGDVAMSKAAWASLQTAGKSIVHVPILLAPMTFFFNLPTTALTTGRLQLQGCTLAGIFQGDIKLWSDPAITADLGYALPAQPITVFVRSASSGTTAVVTSYFLSLPCSPAWKGGAGTNISTWVPSALGAASSVAMATLISTTPFSIGYLDAGTGYASNLAEAALKNSANVFLKSSEANVPAAASLLFKSGGFPTDPSADWSGVTLLNQPGTTTWPLVAMPCVFVRPDMTTRGAAGQLLEAFLAFMLSPEAQALLPSLGLQPLPAEVLTYTATRTLPLLMPDTRSPPYRFEPKTAEYSGAASNVLSALRSTYSLTTTRQLEAAYTAAYAAAANVTVASSNSSAVNASSIAAIGTQLATDLASMEALVAVLTTVSVTGLCFGLVCILLGGLSVWRSYSASPRWGVKPNLANSGVNSANNSMYRGASTSLGELEMALRGAGPSTGSATLCFASSNSVDPLLLREVQKI